MPILKKIFFLSVFVFFFSLMLWGVYIISFKKNPSTTTDSSQETQAPTQEKIKKESGDKISALVEEPVLSFVYFGDKIRFFSMDSKEAFEISFSGSERKNLGSGKIANIANVFWSKDGGKAILKVKSTGGDFSYIAHDFSNNIQSPIKKTLEDIYWQEGANRIFYKYYDATIKARTLNVSDPDGGNWKKLADIPYRFLSISSIPRSGAVSFWNSGDAWDETNLSSIPVIGGEKKAIMKELFGADYLWNNDGTSALISHTNQRGGNKIQLAAINSSGGEYKNLDIPTFISKCAWSKDGKTVYYALPGGIPENSILPNDYKNGDFKTTDTFWKIDTKTGEKKRIVEPEEIKNKFDASQMLLNNEESLLIFLNKIDNKIYKIAL